MTDTSSVSIDEVRALVAERHRFDEWLIALVPYARPGTDALPDAMTPWLDSHHVFLLANHGVTALGTSIESAVHRLESCEQAARILLGAALLGGAQSLPPGEADALRQSVLSPVVVHPESTA